MKTTKILFMIFAFCIVFSGVTIAKTHTGMDMNNDSVRLLKQLNDNGIEARKNDKIIEKPDVSGDIKRAQEKKQEFYDAKKAAFPSLYPEEKTPTKNDIIELNNKIIKDVAETK